MRGKSKYTWYIEPLDSLTNKRIFELVGNGNEFKRLKDDLGKPHDVYICDWSIVYKFFINARKESIFRFRILNKRGNGQIRDVTEILLRRRLKIPA